MSSETPEPPPPDAILPAAGASPETDALGSAVGTMPSRTESAKIRGWHQPLLGSVLLVAVCYVVLWPIVVALVRDASPDSRKIAPMSLPEAIELQAMKAFAVLWVTALGSTVGSFLNVVAYRMPRGKSVIFSPSRCPKCNSDIRPTDNIPVIGWLRLEGKCRSCRNPISPQYPIVEAVVAAIFLLLFAVELISGGANIPVRLPNYSRGIVGVLFELRWDLIQLYLFHCGLFCLLVSWVLIDLDRQRVTWLAVITGLMMLAVPVLWLPHLLPVPVAWPLQYFKPNLQTSAMASLTGAGIGIGLSLLCSWGLTKQKPVTLLVEQADSVPPRTPDPETQALGDLSPRDYYCIESQLNLVSALAFIGIVFGWQAVVAIGLIAMGLRVLGLPLMNRLHFRLPLTAFVLAGALLHQLIWRDVSCIIGPVISETSISIWGLTGIVLFFLTMMLVNRFGLNPARV